jgi:hypothetical protein
MQASIHISSGTNQGRALTI